MYLGKHSLIGKPTAGMTVGDIKQGFPHLIEKVLGWVLLRLAVLVIHRIRDCWSCRVARMEPFSGSPGQLQVKTKLP